ncbi:hypothetical protein BDQ17DRAFT_1287646 [Cyathus striatus]|nr:hypothetical protein BDQ17DRAFT_1287646 [Cyathus striatus]
MDDSAYGGSTGPFHGASQFKIQQAYMVEKVGIERGQDDDLLVVLQKQIAHGAMHNSSERYNLPKCHPGTREELLNEIFAWINHANKEARTMWLHAPVGAGKSVVAQTIAVRCMEEDKLAKSFFFSRHNADRNTYQSLIATIAYQLALYIVEVKTPLADALRNNGPTVWNMSLEWQITKLIVEPLSKTVYFNPSLRRKCLIIDGLDECLEPDMQAEVVRCFTKASSSISGGFLSVLIVSRPELYIRQAFKRERAGSFIPFNLTEKYDPEKDIEWFLRDKFSHIRLYHPLCHNLDSNWPSNEQIEQIVSRSSKQFIYAATVLRFVENPPSNPRKSFERVFDINIINPFAELDSLYMSILRDATRDGEVYQKLLLIFEALLFFRGVKVPQLLDDFLHLDGDIMAILIDVHSIVHIPALNPGPRNEITYYHASFTDFLLDSRRSGKFFIDEALAYLHLSEHCIKCLRKFLKDTSSREERPKTFSPSIRGYFHYLYRSLLLNPEVFSSNDYTAKDGIAVVCKATIESKYATIGFKIQTPKGSITGVL